MRGAQRNRTLLLPEAPIDETDLEKLEEVAGQYLQEAKKQAAESDPAPADKLVFDTFDAIARNYFEHRIRKAQRLAGATAGVSTASPLARPSCLACGATMSLVSIEPNQDGFDLRSFKCPKCDSTEQMVIQYKLDGC
jgi:hypothetical protein